MKKTRRTRGCDGKKRSPARKRDGLGSIQELELKAVGAGHPGRTVT